LASLGIAPGGATPHFGGLCFNAPMLHSAQSTAPQVSRCEPPSWWLDTKHRDITLLLTGINLDRCQVTPANPGIKIRAVRQGRTATHCFVDISIAKNATSGMYAFSITNKAGKATRFTFELVPQAAKRIAPLGTDDNLYLIMPDRFADGDAKNNIPKGMDALYDPKRPRHFHGGDFAGIQSRLPYLKDLGITAIWMTPIYQNASFIDPARKYAGEPVIDYHLYGAMDFYAIDPHLGTPDDLRNMISAAHKSGIKVMQDQVANHGGTYHPWVDNAPTKTWLNPKKDNTWQLMDVMSPAASRAMVDGVTRGWFGGFLPDMNQDDPDCARYLIQNALWWVGMFGFDSIRQDTISYVPRTFWRKWSAALKAEFPGITLLGEVLNGNAAFVSTFQKGNHGPDKVDAGFDTLFDFPAYFAVLNSIRDNDWRGFADTLAHDLLYEDANILVSFAGLHDTPRLAGRPEYGIDRVLVALTIALTLRGIPMVYYGDELGLPGGDDPDNRRHFPGGFPGDARSAFSASGRSTEEARIHGHVRQLLTLRKREKSLRTGKVTILTADHTGLVFVREAKGSRPVMVAVRGRIPARMPAIEVIGAPKARGWKPIFDGTFSEITPKHLTLAFGHLPVAVYLGE
jgi:glycosidase